MTVALAVSVCPRIEFKPVESNSTLANSNLEHMGANLAVETIAIHAEIETCVPQPHEARRKRKAQGAGQSDGCLRVAMQGEQHLSGRQARRESPRARGRGGSSAASVVRPRAIQSSTSDRSQPTWRPR